MLHHWFPRASTARMSAAAMLLTLACQTADAQVKPFRITGRGPAPDGLSIIGGDSPHSATGKATCLGKYTGNGVANVLSFDPETGSGTFHGYFVFVAANGDKLAFTYGDTENDAEQAGQFQVFDAGGGDITVTFIAEFNPIPALCTGRFRNVVDGSFIMVAKTDPFPLQIDVDGYTPPFDYTWHGRGWIEFGE